MNPGIFGLPDPSRTEQWFYASGAGGTITDTKNWQRWTKPKNCQFVLIKLIGAGAGGGNGFSDIANNPRGGGGGGGSGATAQALFLASMLPDTLWLQIPKGGAATQPGARAVVAFSQSVTTTNVLLYSGQADAATGGNGTAGAGGGAGSGSTVLLITAGAYTFWALAFASQAGANGATGGAHTGATGGAVSQAYPVSGGAGGGGTTTTQHNGGNLTGIGAVQFARPTISGGAQGNPASAGPDGHNMFAGFLLNCGGAGGGSSISGNGGNGGNGGIGSGGGGGGAGVTGGTGGTGGDGLGLIVTW